MAENITSTLKQLRGYKNSLLKEKSLLEIKLKHIESDITNLNNHILGIDKKIDSVLKTGLTVTDHAIIRYLQRVQQIDISLVPAKIITEDLRKNVNKLGDGHYPVDDFIVVVSDNVVVTVYKDK